MALLVATGKCSKSITCAITFFFFGKKASKGKNVICICVVAVKCASHSFTNTVVVSKLKGS